MLVLLHSSAIHGTSALSSLSTTRKTARHLRKHYPSKLPGSPSDQINLKVLTSRVVQLTRRRQLEQIFEEVEIAKKLHGKLNTIVMNAVIQACVHCHDIESALRVFAEMSKPEGCGVDAISYGTLLKGLGNARRIDDAFQLLESVELGTAVGNPQLSEALICGLLNALIESGDLRRANGLLARYCHVLQQGGKPSILSFNLLIKGYISVGCPQAALGIHEEILRRGVNPDRITYNHLIYASIKAGNLDAATEFYEKMKDKALKEYHHNDLPDLVTYTTLLQGFRQVKDLLSIEKILIEMKSRNKLRIDRVAYTTIVDALLSCGSIKGALCVFGEMIKQAKANPTLRPKPHLFMSMMRAFAAEGDYGMVRRLYERMWFDSVGTISAVMQLESDHLLMEAALNEGLVELAMQKLRKVIRKWRDISWSSREGMVALRLEALMGLNTSMLCPIMLPQISLSGTIETIMTPFNEAQPLPATMLLEKVVMRFFKDSVVPIIDDWGGCVGILHREDCDVLDAPLSALMRSPPPCVTSSTSIGYIIDLMLQKRHKMIIIVKYGDFHGLSYGTSVRAIGVFTHAHLTKLSKASSSKLTDEHFYPSASNTKS
ncbi:pentatricopeptide repeat-containing protein-like [Dorcoceras hygrometricum]|uniref:Pentatricopeptide repeat-containing protein-like n=1 Tax=Dorcoceras hygrometricum TaxID=472368 RepID=A0A2Z7CWQ0_9LAMI|nr:pentatricopeptide repeat-containing protein-like [Dorcoceras hygrometricum]